jgi:lipoprotein LprG
MLLRRALAPFLAPALLLGVLLLGVAACSGGSDQSAPQLLQRAKTTLDQAPSLHFLLTSENAPATGTSLIGGEGDVERPNSFAGTLKVSLGGGAVDLKVVSVGGTVYAQLPFQQEYGVVDPTQFGLSDPGKLLDPDTGISQLLTAAQDPKLGKESRVDGEVVREVTATLPGDLVQRVLTSKDPSQPVPAVMSIATDSGQLRRVALTGPFFAAGSTATYTLQLSGYGADVSITAPPTG